MMKQRLQMTIVEPTISTPAWRSDSPKNLKTRPRSSSPRTRAENLTRSPNDDTQSAGSAVTGLRREPFLDLLKRPPQPRGSEAMEGGSDLKSGESLNRATQP